jgi:hypothetical protein
MKGIKTRDSGRVGLSLFHIYFLAGCLGPVLPILPVASKTTDNPKETKRVPGRRGDRYCQRAAFD